MTLDVREIELVVTDLDGTLWHREDSIHERSLAAWAELERRGIPVLVATGRRVGSVRRALTPFRLAPSAVCLNGALGVDLVDGERRFHRAVIAPEAAMAILTAFRSEGLSPCVYVDRDDVEVFVGARPSTHPEHVASFDRDVAVDDLDRVCADDAVLAFSLLGHTEAPLVAVVEAIGDAGVPHLSAERGYGGHGLTVAGPGMSKWNGVAAFCAKQRIDPGRVLAIGDGPNDVELLTRAAVAVAPADAHQAALDAAERVVAPAVEGGWAEILDLLPG